MNNKFRIGELARIFNISTDTLRHYDKIGLLKPEQDDINHYRYYDITSMFKLSRILFIKNLDISLSEIDDYMNNKNADRLLHMLKKKDEELEHKIHHLQNLKHKINTKLDLFEHYKTKHDTIYLQNLDNRFGVFIKTSGLDDESKIIDIFKRTGKYIKNSSWLVEGQVYTSLAKKDIEEGIFNQFRYFVEVSPSDVDRIDHLVCIPKGEYVCMTVVGPYEELINRYLTLVDWINQNGYVISGDSIENNIVDNDYSESAEEFITELQIPIKPKE